MKNMLKFLIALLPFALLGGCSESGSDVDGVELSTPTNVTCAGRTDTQLRFSWDEVKGADSYSCKILSKSGNVMSVQDVTVTSCEYSSLTPETKYGFAVRAVAGSVVSDFCEVIYATTRPTGYDDMTPLATPVAEFVEAQSNALTFAWNEVEGAESYHYQLKSLSGNVVAEADTDLLTVTINKGLAAGASYKFAVKAVPNAMSETHYESEYSEAVIAQTIPNAESIVKFPAWEADGVVRAFPGAEGAGMYTTGGRGGKVIHVTTLNDSGPGSLRAAISESGPRIIVFDVAGTISLNSDLKIRNGNVTIYGQTAPGDGICLKNRSLTIATDNVIIQYLRVRPGDESGNDGTDCMNARYMKDIIIDHCSMSWSTDEAASFYVNKNMTMQWCTIYEALHNSAHAKGSHSYGGIWGGAPASFHHNILAHHDSRNPRYDGPEQYADQEQASSEGIAKQIYSTDRKLDVRNNVVYNFCNYGGYGGVGITMNFIGNYYKWGPASVYGCGPSYKDGTESANKAVKRRYFFMADNTYSGNGLSKPVNGNPNVYIGDNQNNVFDTSVGGDSSIGASITADNKSGMTWGSTGSLTPVWTWATSQHAIVADGKSCHVTTHSGQDGFDKVVRWAGASLSKDSADERVAADITNGTGTSGENDKNSTNAAGFKRSWYGIIDSQNDKGGYPTLTATTEEIARAATDSDKDGIPDYYEELLGLDKNSNDAGEITLDPQGLYTNIEVYAYYLVQDIVAAQNEGGRYTSLD